MQRYAGRDVADDLILVSSHASDAPSCRPSGHCRLLRFAGIDRHLLLEAHAPGEGLFHRGQYDPVVARWGFFLSHRLQRVHLCCLLRDGVPLRPRCADLGLEFRRGNAGGDDLPGGPLAPRPHHQSNRVSGSTLQPADPSSSRLGGPSSQDYRRWAEDLCHRHLCVRRPRLRPEGKRSGKRQCDGAVHVHGRTLGRRRHRLHSIHHFDARGGGTFPAGVCQLELDLVARPRCASRLFLADSRAIFSAVRFRLLPFDSSELQRKLGFRTEVLLRA